MRESRQHDEHNEVCEVCETGGDLLCCETCTLVYHLSCLRPKINSVPKGSWSCVQCVIDVRVIDHLTMQNANCFKIPTLSHEIIIVGSSSGRRPGRAVEPREDDQAGQPHRPEEVDRCGRQRGRRRAAAQVQGVHRAGREVLHTTQR